MNTGSSLNVLECLGYDGWVSSPRFMSEPPLRKWRTDAPVGPEGSFHLDEDS